MNESNKIIERDAHVLNPRQEALFNERDHLIRASLHFVNYMTEVSVVRAVRII